ncbi:MAG: hypothetical protein KatS3mg077_0329 [Candidatus Binatia bacterium]|nr:MAG: hypothetical protein KatS3mg077_0329 [Candidatus Binatia bacterium]
MRVRPGQVQSLAHAILETLVQRDLIQPKADLVTIEQRIADLLYRNLEEEAALEQEAEEMAEQYLRGREDLDRRKVVLGIKQRLARDRGFVL